MFDDDDWDELSQCTVVDDPDKETLAEVAVQGASEECTIACEDGAADAAEAGTTTDPEALFEQCTVECVEGGVEAALNDLGEAKFLVDAEKKCPDPDEDDSSDSSPSQDDPTDPPPPPPTFPGTSGDPHMKTFGGMQYLNFAWFGMRHHFI